MIYGILELKGIFEAINSLFFHIMEKSDLKLSHLSRKKERN